MSRIRRKRKREANKQSKSPTIVPPSPGRAKSPPPLSVAELRPEQTAFASKEIIIAAPAGLCFDTLAKQLERSPEWDLIVVNARPVSDVRTRIGATSQVTLDLGGRKIDSQAIISRYRPNRSLSWVTTGKPRVRQDWSLKLKPYGTMVHVSLAHELNSWAVGRLLYKLTRWKRVEQNLGKMLIGFKKAIESIIRDQQRLAGGVKS